MKAKIAKLTTLLNNQDTVSVKLLLVFSIKQPPIVANIVLNVNFLTMEVGKIAEVGKTDYSDKTLSK